MAGVELPPHQCAVALTLAEALGTTSAFTFARYGNEEPTAYTATIELAEPNEGLRVVATLQGRSNDVFLVPTDGDTDAIGHILVSIEDYGRLHSLGLGHTIPISATSARERGWAAVILMAPGDLLERLATEITVAGRVGRCFWVLFIDQDEYDLKCARGFDAFLGALKDRDLVKW